MHIFGSYFLMQIKRQIQYKVSFVLASIGQFFTALTSYYGIRFIFDRIHAVDEFTYEQVLLCFSVVMMAFSLGQMFGGGFSVFPVLLSDGRFDRILVRPRSILLQVIAPEMDFTRIGLLLQSILLLCYVIPLSGIKWTCEKKLVFCLMIVCGSILFFCLFLITATCSFFTIAAMDFLNVFTYGTRQFGRFPFSVYGQNMLMFFTFVIPLALFQYYPLLFLLDINVGLWYAISPLGSLLFLIPTYFFFQYGLRKYVSTGS